MGLGKTLQVITLLLKFKQENKLDKQKALIVVPTTLLTNWEKEVKKFAPELQTFIYHGTSRKQHFEEADIILTTYGVTRSDITILQKIKWAVLAIDEAQNIKNVDTEQTKAVKKLKAGYIVAMSGTPVENRLSEYWSIFDFANKGYLGALNGFKEAYIKPIELLRDQEQLESFKKITAPFIMRRLKTDKTIISDLPDKVEIDQLCTLTTEQAALYESFLETMMRQIEGSDEGVQRQGLVFKLMIALKQICNHPSNFLKKDTIQPELSGKTLLLRNLLDNILEVGEKTLIFTQYKEMGDLLVQFIQETYQFSPLWLHGGCSRTQRDEMVEIFQHKPNPKVMILSLKAGGTGLNLTQANHVIHYDLWWNPAVEAQATDRAYRIGQKKNVQVHRFITQSTFEEKINAMIQAKKELASLTVSTGENWIGNLSNEDLKYIFKLG
jgi:SNF2 family DNA or RNA helicase